MAGLHVQPFIRNVDFVSFLFRQFVNLSDANLQALILGIGSVLALTRILFSLLTLWPQIL